MIKFSYLSCVVFILIFIQVVISSFQSRDLLPNDLSNSASGWDNGAEEMALLFDGGPGGGEGGIDIPIPAVPIQIPEGVPDLVDVIRQWLSNPNQPECRDNKHLVCCERGAPTMKSGKVLSGRPPVVAPDTQAQIDPLEYSQRRRECRIWSADNPACRLPENVYCCHCLDIRRAGYLCYNQPYTDLPELQNRRPIPEPRKISNPPGRDPNPVEQPSDNPRKRDIIGNGNTDPPPQIAPFLKMEDPLYAESPPLLEMAAGGIGRKRNPETCTDEFLESVRVSTYRYKYPSRNKPSEDYWHRGDGWLDFPNTQYP